MLLQAASWSIYAVKLNLENCQQTRSQHQAQKPDVKSQQYDAYHLDDYPVFLTL
jgi:hypothetical protein